MKTFAGSKVIPTFRYRDAPAMIEWLTRTFGFEKHAVHMGPNNSVAHAQLTLGSGMIMLGSIDPATSSDHGVAETQSVYIVVSDCEAVYATAQKAGAVIVGELEEKDYGGEGFGCRDPEGHLWSFGSYDPWQTGP